MVFLLDTAGLVSTIEKCEIFTTMHQNPITKGVLLREKSSFMLASWYHINIFRFGHFKAFFAQSVHCIASSCMAKYIVFVGKSVVLHLFEGPELRTHY